MLYHLYGSVLDGGVRESIHERAALQRKHVTSAGWRQQKAVVPVVRLEGPHCEEAYVAGICHKNGVSAHM
eukprot:10371573-Karenia_brevis.AAC.1